MNSKNKPFQRLVLWIFISISPFLLTVSNCAAQAKPKSTSASQSKELNEEGVLAMKGGDLNAAESIFKKAVEADPYNLTAVFNYTGVLLSAKKSDAAISILQSYIENDLKDPGIFVRLGDAYFATKKISDAQAMYEKASNLAPKYLGLWRKLGTVYALNQNTQSAEKALRNAVKEDPKDAQSLANLSSILLSNGNFQESISFAKRAIQLSPNPEAYITLGSAYERLKNIDDALIAFKRAKDLGDITPELEGKIKELEASKH